MKEHNINDFLIDVSHNDKLFENELFIIEFNHDVFENWANVKILFIRELNVLNRIFIRLLNESKLFFHNLFQKNDLFDRNDLFDNDDDDNRFNEKKNFTSFFFFLAKFNKKEILINAKFYLIKYKKKLTN